MSGGDTIVLAFFCSSVVVLTLESILWNWCQRRYFKTFKEPRNRIQRSNSTSLCCMAGRYDNPIPTRFLASIDCSKIPVLATDLYLLLIPSQVYRPASKFLINVCVTIEFVLLSRERIGSLEYWPVPAPPELSDGVWLSSSQLSSP
jgi:hypothetical protein